MSDPETKGGPSERTINNRVVAEELQSAVRTLLDTGATTEDIKQLIEQVAIGRKERQTDIAAYLDANKVQLTDGSDRGKRRYNNDDGEGNQRQYILQYSDSEWEELPVGTAIYPARKSPEKDTPLVIMFKGSDHNIWEMKFDPKSFVINTEGLPYTERLIQHLSEGGLFQFIKPGSSDYKLFKKTADVLWRHACERREKGVQEIQGETATRIFEI
ncbi:hypothetical protein ACFL2V_21580 [Pseudomonadota bacterium]